MSDAQPLRGTGLEIRPEVFAALPGLKVVAVVARGIRRPADPAPVEQAWQKAWDGAGEQAVYGNAQSHPRVAPWRAAFHALGVSGKRFPTSIEALLRRALKGGAIFRIHPLVDFYNAVSLSHVMPAGGYDLAEVDGPLVVRTTVAGDTFRSLDAAEAEDVPPGELAYACGDEILTRHLVWRQSRRALIGPETRDAVLVSEALPEIPDEVFAAVESDLRQGLEDWFGASTTSYHLDVERTAIAW